MSDTNATSKTRASVPQILARVLLLQQEHKLPNPHGVAADDDDEQFGHLRIDLDARTALDRWIEVAGLQHEEIKHTRYDGDRHGYWIHVLNWPAPGWAVQLKAILQDPETTTAELDAETVASLEEIAAGPAPTLWRTYTGAQYQTPDQIPCHVIANGELVAANGDPIHGDHPEILSEIIRRGTTVYRDHAYAKVPTIGCDHSVVAPAAPLVSDETIAEAEQLSRMVSPVDLALPKAPCGCPVKGDETSTWVDHCQACVERSAVTA